MTRSHEPWPFAATLRPPLSLSGERQLTDSETARQALTVYITCTGGEIEIRAHPNVSSLKPHMVRLNIDCRTSWDADALRCLGVELDCLAKMLQKKPLEH